MNTTPEEIRALITDMERRAAAGELFATIALPGWRAALRSATKEETDGHRPNTRSPSRLRP